MANAFNGFFTKVGPNLDNDIPKKPRSPSIYLKKKQGTSIIIYDRPTTPNKISKL